MKKWKEKLEEAKNHLINCERLYYVGLSILKEQRILINVLKELSISANKTIESFLIYKCKNFNNEKDKISYFIKNFGVKILTREEIVDFLEIIKFLIKIKETPLDFVRRERVIIYSQGKYEIITKEKVRIYSRIIHKLIKELEKLN